MKATVKKVVRELDAVRWENLELVVLPDNELEDHGKIAAAVLRAAARIYERSAIAHLLRYYAVNPLITDYTFGAKLQLEAASPTTEARTAAVLLLERCAAEINGRGAWTADGRWMTIPEND